MKLALAATVAALCLAVAVPFIGIHLEAETWKPGSISEPLKPPPTITVTVQSKTE